MKWIIQFYLCLTTRYVRLHFIGFSLSDSQLKPYMVWIACGERMEWEDLGSPLWPQRTKSFTRGHMEKTDEHDSDGTPLSSMYRESDLSLHSLNSAQLFGKVKEASWWKQLGLILPTYQQRPTDSLPNVPNFQCVVQMEYPAMPHWIVRDRLWVSESTNVVYMYILETLQISAPSSSGWILLLSKNSRRAAERRL